MKWQSFGSKNNMEKYKILNTIGDSFSQEGKQILETFGDVDYKLLDQEELDKIIEQYDMVVVGLGVNFHKETLQKAKKLKVIATATTGLDHIDVDFAKENDIDVVSLRGEREFLDTLTATSELAWGLVIGLMRRIPWAFNAVKNHKWNREDFRARFRLYGKTLGIIGMGRLGTHIAQYGKAFGMEVLFFDPYIEKSEISGCKKVSLEELVENSDVISIHVHLNEKTEGMIHKDIFTKMHPHTIIVNTSRGKVVNEEDLLHALKSKKIGGYATDVLGGELNFKEGNAQHPLIEHSKTQDNVLIVPHIGGLTNDSREETDIFIAHKLKKYFERK